MKRVCIFVILIATAFLPSRSVYGQTAKTLPPWTDDSRRAAQYPVGEWYVGYSVDNLKSGANIADVRKRIENEAKSQIAKNISDRVQAVSQSGTSSQRTQATGANSNETIKKSYDQKILSSTDVELGKVDIITHHDEANNKIYAMASVKKVDLAAYYASRIELYLQNAENNFKLAKLFAESDKKRSALENTAAAKKNINECNNYDLAGKYYVFLNAIDDKRALKLQNKAAELMREIAAFETELTDAKPIFITGREIMDGSGVDITIPALQSKFSENGCRITDNAESAGYILTLDITNCQSSKDANFTYCGACVKADLANVKTGKTDAKLSFTSKTGWTTADMACRKAFEEAAKDLWKKIRETTEICK